MIAVVGASPRPERHSHQVTSYLAAAGYDVLPIRPDRAEVAGRVSFASLRDVGGSIDIALVYRRPDAVAEAMDDAVAKHAEAVWLPPGVSSRAIRERAKRLGLELVEERCMELEHRHVMRTAGHPRKVTRRR